MIGYPGVERLLARYGSTARGRSKAREEIRACILAEARRQAAVAGLSYNCAHGRHAELYEGMPVGCANSGSGCICECHDPVDELRPAED